MFLNKVEPLFLSLALIFILFFLIWKSHNENIDRITWSSLKFCKYEPEYPSEQLLL